MTGGGIECVLRVASDHHRGYEVRCEVSPLSGLCACLHHWITETRRRTNRQTHRCSEQAGLSALRCGTGAVTGGD